LGANVFSMGVVGSLVGWSVFRLVRALGGGLAVSAFLAGLCADWGTYAATSLILGLGIRGEAPLVPLVAKIALAFIPTQLPLGILEGFLTAGMVTLLRRRRPDLLVKMKLLKEVPGHA
jgi:cobalt/nickel transport system permease protein